VSTEPIESIASHPSPAAPAASCSACGAPLAEDQRYCLQCGERATPISSVLAAPPPALAAGAGATVNGPGPPPSALATAGAAAPSPPGAPGDGEAPGRGSAVTVIAGVGVLLLAMGIGVLIGRSDGAKPSGAAAAQVITVSTAPAAGATPASESFTGDWPAGSSGYTVQLQALPAASTQVSAVQSAKSAAEGKGAKSVGALKSDEFTGLPAGEYIVYSGKYSKRAGAEKALAGLKKSFPEASVLHVGASGGASGGKGAAAGTGQNGGGKSGAGSSPSSPAPPAVVESLKGKSGKNYEQESKNLPNVVSTG
jgi:septal ring-binding cell division protein DamX